MKPTQREATQLAELFAKTWTTGPRQGIWFDVVSECDLDIAQDTYRHLRDTCERAPSIAMFRAEYRARVQPTPTTHTRTCQTCDGTGMRTARQRIGPTTHDVVVACADCRAGAAAAKTLRRADEHNASRSGPERQTDVGPVEADRHDTDNGPTMSFAEYLSRLTTTAAAGDPDAARMLDMWEHNLQRMPKDVWAP